MICEISMFEREHEHVYNIPKISNYWQQNRKEYFIDGHVVTRLDVVCRCGHILQTNMDISMKSDDTIYKEVK